MCRGGVAGVGEGASLKNKVLTNANSLLEFMSIACTHNLDDLFKLDILWKLFRVKNLLRLR